MHLEKLLKYCLEAALSGGATYAEATGVEIREKSFSRENGCPQSGGRREEGIALRLIASGRWGFAAGPANGKTEAAALVQGALAGAAALPPRTFAVGFSPAPSLRGNWRGPCQEDPFTLPDSRPTEILAETDRAMDLDHLGSRRSFLHFRRERRLYRNSEASATDQTFTLVGGGVQALAFRRGEVQQRSWPAPGGAYAQGGYEHIAKLDLPRRGREAAEEALALIQAPPCPEGVLDLVLAGPLLAEQLFSSLEWLDPARPLDRISSPQITLVADAALAGGTGSYGYDAEGVQARSFPLVAKGKVVNYLAGREGGAALGAASLGNMSWGSWQAPPFALVANLLLEPGGHSLDQLIQGIERGLFLDTPRVPAAFCPQGRAFLAQAETGRMIENGVLTHLVKAPLFRGQRVAFWHGCDAVASAAHQETLGFFRRGAARGALVSPLRLRGVRVGEGQ